MTERPDDDFQKTPQTAPPGWAQAPDGSWHHIGVATPGAAPAPAPTKKKKKHRFRNFVVLPIVAIVAIAAALGNGSDDSPTTDSKPASAPKAADAAPAAMGSTVTAGDFGFVVNSMKCGVASVGPDVIAEKAQGQFCLVKIAVTNNGKEPGTFNDSSQALFDSAGAKYTPSTSADISIEDNDVFLADINPGNTVSGTLAFDVPDSFTPDHLELVSGFGVMDKPATVAVRATG